MTEKSLEQLVMEAIDLCIHTRCKRCEYGGDISARRENRSCQGRLIADHLRKNGVEVTGCGDKAPTIDTVPVVHGHWTGLTSSDYACAEGMAEWFTEEQKKEHRENFEHTTHCSICNGGFDDRHTKNWKFCPRCGAKMDGERRGAAEGGETNA